MRPNATLINKVAHIGMQDPYRNTIEKPTALLKLLLMMTNFFILLRPLKRLLVIYCNEAYYKSWLSIGTNWYHSELSEVPYSTNNKRVEIICINTVFRIGSSIFLKGLNFAIILSRMTGQIGFARGSLAPFQSQLGRRQIVLLWFCRAPKKATPTGS